MGYSIQSKFIRIGDRGETHWIVTVSRNKKSFETPYRMGSAWRDKPDLENVIYSLVFDASCVRHGQSFRDFCEEYGYESDPPAALDTYNGCIASWHGLVKLGSDLDALDAIYQDY